MAQLQEWRQMVGGIFGSPPGRPVEARALLRVAHQPGATLEDLQDSGKFGSIDCKLADGLSAVLNAEPRHRMKN
eukprot:5481567-Pyramimonas_sp.AAC.1